MRGGHLAILRSGFGSTKESDAVRRMRSDRWHAVLTSDDADIAKVNRELILVHV
jgi:hypothetical protein